MRIFIKNSFHSKEGHLFILTIKFVEGEKIFTGDELFNETNPAHCFKVKYIPTGTYNFEEDSFDIGIEDPSVDLKEFEQKEFKLKNETNRHTKRLV